VYDRQAKNTAAWAGSGAFRLGLERREVEKRICERKRLTASAAFHVYKIPPAFEQRITELKTKYDEIVNDLLSHTGKDQRDLKEVPIHQQPQLPLLELHKASGDVQP